MDQLGDLIEHYPLLGSGLSLAGVFVLASLLRLLTRAILKRTLKILIVHTKWRWDDVLWEHGFFHRLTQMVTPLVVKFSLQFIPDLPPKLTLLLHNLTSAITIMFAALAASTVLNALQALYTENSVHGVRSIKSYVQIGKIIIFSLATIVVVSMLIDKSPLILLSGLGAMSAVLLLVFRDTLLSFVASVLLASNDMLRVGEWIEMPQVGADGSVIDIALHTVKVQNWDYTITTIPTWRLIAESFKNWRGMQQSGGRRIMRNLRIDTHSVHFLDENEIAHLRKLKLLRDYLQEKTEAVAATNAELGEDAEIAANRRRLTNIGTFRAYALAYLKAHPQIHKSMTCMARQLAPGAEGVGIEVYCFTNTTDWIAYETIQGDIFDHLLSILPEFGLQLFQNPAGADLRSLRCGEKHA